MLSVFAGTKVHVQRSIGNRKGLNKNLFCNFIWNLFEGCLPIHQVLHSCTVAAAWDASTDHELQQARTGNWKKGKKVFCFFIFVVLVSGWGRVCWIVWNAQASLVSVADLEANRRQEKARTFLIRPCFIIRTTTVYGKTHVAVAQKR